MSDAENDEEKKDTEKAPEAGPVKPERAEDGKGKKQKPTKAEKAQAQAEYRSARAELKAARKRAGKSNAPKVVGGIVLALVLVAGGAAAGWFFTNQWSTQQISALQGQLSNTQQQLDQANDQVNATTSILDGGSKAYAGTWRGDLISTLGAATKRCYGATGKGMSLNIESISATGQMQLDVKLLYHGHETATLANDVTGDSGDGMLESGNITSTFSSKSFTFRVETGKEGNYAVVTVSPTTSADAHIQLGCVVESYYKDGLVETDQYLLKKKDDDSPASEGTLSADESADSADSAGSSSVD